MLPTYKIYKDDNGHWHGTLKAANGKVLMQTPSNEQYKRKASVINLRKYLQPHIFDFPGKLKITGIVLSLFILLSFSATAQKHTIYGKDFSDFRLALNTAIIQGDTLIISDASLSNDCIPEQHEVYDGNLSLSTGTIHFSFRKAADIPLYGMILGNGNFTFKNITFICDEQTDLSLASCFYVPPGSTNKVTFINCIFKGWLRNYVNQSCISSVTYTGCQ